MVRSRSKNRRNRTSGVTLLEIMIVLAIIALIATLAAPRIMNSFGRAKTQAAEIQIENLKVALQLDYIDVGRYPSEAESLAALLEAPSASEGWAGPYTEPTSLIDPWGRQYLYKQPGQNGEFDLLSFGRDGQPGGSNEDSDISL